MTDIVERLRQEGADAMSKHLSMGMWKLCAGAADEIERLRTQLAIQYGMKPGGDLARATQARIEGLKAEITRLRGALDNVVQAKDDTVLTIALDYARKVLAGFRAVSAPVQSQD